MAMRSPSKSLALPAEHRAPRACPALPPVPAAPCTRLRTPTPRPARADRRHAHGPGEAALRHVRRAVRVLLQGSRHSGPHDDARHGHRSQLQGARPPRARRAAPGGRVSESVQACLQAVRGGEPGAPAPGGPRTAGGGVVLHSARGSRAWCGAARRPTLCAHSGGTDEHGRAGRARRRRCTARRWRWARPTS